MAWVEARRRVIALIGPDADQGSPTTHGIGLIGFAVRGGQENQRSRPGSSPVQGEAHAPPVGEATDSALRV
jgi:hypothetical protein